MTPAKRTDQDVGMARLQAGTVALDGPLPTKCWIWQGATNSSGYGVIRVKKRLLLTHRWAWALVHGPVPKRLDIAHQCHRRNCCNPDHVQAQSHAANIKAQWHRRKASSLQTEAEI